MTSTQSSDLEQLHLPDRPAQWQPHTSVPVGPIRTRTGPARLFLGPVDSPPWARPLLWLLLVGTGAFYLVDITANGYANDFYAAAVKSSTESWKAWLFASLDSSNAITVDKPPAAMWIMGLSGRIFGFSSASMLIPQALMGVGTVALLYASVKRWFGPGAGLVAGALLALTPVAALMFRFNNPDALLVLLMTAAAYCVIRAIEQPVPSVDGGKKSRAVAWLLLAGTAIGIAFLTKMLQGLLVLPGFALAYLWAAPSKMWTRIWHLLAALGAVIVSAGWFVVLVAVWPASSRPYIGGSTDNSLWELAIGYNGLGRIFGESSTLSGATSTGTGGFGGGGGGSMFGGATGLGRMFGSSFGTQISWLIPAALVALIAGLAFTARAVRTDRTRAAMVLWGGWLLVTALTFSYMEGTVHPYYSIALAPAIAALVAIGGREMWRGRGSSVVRGLLALMITVTAAWSFRLMQVNAPTWHPELRWITLVGGLLGAALLAASVARLRRLAVVGVLVGSLTAGAGMTAWAVDTVATAHTGSTPTAGPATAGDRGGFGGFGGFAGRTGSGSFPGSGDFPGGGDFAGGEFPGGGTIPGGSPTSGTGGTTARAGAGGTTTASTAVVALLEATTTRWAAATTSATSADPYILGSDKAIMAIGGFTGSDPSPTLAQFQEYVRTGQISYFISGRGGFGGGRGGDSSSISSWVSDNYKSSTVDGVTIYDLRAPVSGS